MANSVCLTTKQQKFYNYVINYYKSNGHFPNSSRAGRDLEMTAQVANAMYGVLLQKGAFSDGQPLIDGSLRRHNTTKVPAFNLGNIKLTFAPKATKVKAAKPKANPNRELATLLVRMLAGEDVKAEMLQTVATL